MSSDTFHIKLQRHGLNLELHCTTGTAAGADDHAMTRSFVLLALAGEARDDAPLLAELLKLDFRNHEVDEAFYQAHVGKFIAWTRLLRRDHVGSERLRRQHTAELIQQGVASAEEKAEAKYPRHAFVVQARLTDERWAERVPDAFGTTAFDVWSDDPEYNPPNLDGRVAADGPLGRTASFPGVAVTCLAGSSDGARVFARMQHVVGVNYTGLGYPSPEAHPGGVVVALDAERLAVQAQLDLGPLLRRDGHAAKTLAWVRVSPRGDSVVLGFYAGPALQYGFGERTGELLSTIPPKGPSIADVQWDAAGRDFVRVSGGEVADGRGPVVWPTVFAEAAVLDDARIAVLVDVKALAVLDRATRKETLRVPLTKATELALLPEGQVAVVDGPGSKAKIRVFQPDGAELASVNMRWATHLRASPSGLLATRSMSLQIYDPVTARVVELKGNSPNEHAWLGDERLATLNENTVGVRDVAAALAEGTVKKVKVATAKTKAAAAAAPPKPPAPAIKLLVDEAIEAVRARRGPLGFARGSGKFKKFLLSHLPAHVVAQLEGAIEVEVGWTDATTPKFKRWEDARPEHIRGATAGQHHFVIQGEKLYPPWKLAIGDGDAAAQGALALALDGKPLTGAAFQAAWLPFAFYDGRWVALSYDGLRAVTGTRDMLTWKTDPRSLATILDDALTWLRDVA